VYFTGSATGKGGDGDYGPFWNDNVSLTDLDRPARTYSPINRGEDEDATNPDSTGGFFRTFQGVNPRQFSLTSTAKNPPVEFDKIVLGNPETATAPAGGQAAAAISAAPPQAGTYFIRPRVRAHRGGVAQNLWVDRIMVRGNYFTVYFTGSATGKGGDGEYGPYWNDGVSLTDLDRPSRTYSPVNRGEDEDASNPDSTGGFFRTFQGVNPRQFSLSSSVGNPPMEFDRVILGEPD